MLITTIGRGHSGTRLLPNILKDSGVFIGDNTNGAGDKLPPSKMYEAVKHINSFVKYLGNNKWSFSYLLDNEPDKKFRRLINEYLSDVLKSNEKIKGWKLPETTYTFPWLVKMFPDAKYVIWWRHPYEALLNEHYSDNFKQWNLEPYQIKGGIISWFYQYSLIKATPSPKNILHVKYEDFVFDVNAQLKRIEKFLGLKLVNNTEIRTNRVHLWKKEDREYNYEFLREPMEDLGYCYI